MEVLNLGGGFNITRGDEEESTDLAEMAARVLKLFTEFNAKTGRDLRMEIEPGSYLVANSGLLLAKVIDLTSTHSESLSTKEDEGHNFVTLNTGLNEMTMQGLYGSQHSLKFFPHESSNTFEGTVKPYAVVGHCGCRDLITCQPGECKELREI